MNLFKRLFKAGQSQAHAVAEKLEDPIRMTEQGIRDLKTDLEKTMRSLAEVKASEIRIRKDAINQTRSAEDYKRKAMLLLQRVQGGQLDAAEGDRLAQEALTLQQSTAARGSELLQEADRQKEMVSKLETNIQRLKSAIQKYENDLITLKARARTAAASSKINKQLSGLDSGGTVAMLERMKQKVEEEESLAESYEELADSTAGVDDQIDRALGPGSAAGSQSLEELKKKMGLLGSSQE